jgi:hypothetical protein
MLRHFLLSPDSGHGKMGLSEKAGIDISILSATLLLELFLVLPIVGPIPLHFLDVAAWLEWH